jgi:type IV pilus assembly protein PilX
VTRQHCASAGGQRGVALVTSLLLLLIITIVALSMFRGLGTQERIAGNVREKERALHAAMTAQQYAEWWLTVPINLANGAQVCDPAAALLNANANQTQICANSYTFSNLGIDPASVPWQTAPGAYYGISYTPAGMCIAGSGCTTGSLNDPSYAAVPMFYIADMGVAADGQGEAYQIDAAGYGGSTNAVAVVESTFEVQQGVTCRSCGQ